MFCINSTRDNRVERAIYQGRQRL